MGRQLPTECEHGRIIDYGDFGPDEDGLVGIEGCAECGIAGDGGANAQTTSRPSVSDSLADRVPAESAADPRSPVMGSDDVLERHPRPWRWNAEDAVVEDAKGFGVFYFDIAVPADADARGAFIVEAVNAYEPDHVEALQRRVGELEGRA